MTKRANIRGTIADHLFCNVQREVDLRTDLKVSDGAQIKALEAVFIPVRDTAYTDVNLNVVVTAFDK